MKQSICCYACHATRKLCDVYHVTPKVFYIGHVTPPKCAILVMWPEKSVLFTSNKEWVVHLIHPRKILYILVKDEPCPSPFPHPTTLPPVPPLSFTCPPFFSLIQFLAPCYTSLHAPLLTLQTPAITLCPPVALLTEALIALPAIHPPVSLCTHSLHFNAPKLHFCALLLHFCSLLLHFCAPVTLPYTPVTFLKKMFLVGYSYLWIILFFPT